MSRGAEAVAAARVWPVAVVGAGPAGLSAAVTAADHGIDVLLVDAGGAPGGQYWRQPGDVVPGGRDPDGRETRPHAEHGGRRLTTLWDALQRHRDSGRLTLLSRTQVWQAVAEDGVFALGLTPSPGSPPGPARVRAERLVLCPGGADRQLPLPGWDLPGVMAAGGVQSLLKGSGTLAGRRVVVAGTGPFLLPVATGLARAGAEVRAVCEAGRPVGWARDLAAVAGVPSKLVEGAGLAAAMVRHRIPYRTRTVVRRAVGTEELEAVELVRLGRDGRPGERVERVEADLLAVGWGFTPALELGLQLGAATRVDVDTSLVLEVDERQRTDVPGVWVAGEACGVGGSVLSDLEGRVAGAAAAEDAGAPPRAGTPARAIGRHRRFARSMHRNHPVPEHWADWLTDDTLLCRCEEVEVGRLREARDELGASDARAVKQVTRIGMGWCQGRVCGFAAACLTAGLEGREVAERDLRALGSRPLAVPVTLAELASLPTGPGQPPQA
ncbi:NAD(P)/FAD-dependent oxidoreductase [Auraticoccus monumenti]|uniref:Pyruvate/2-oxoglutarate dehydrogenase complex, dihydrolipoamide dehydrogenase (E3) component n=1 Tax=Auraticoccus monumenti TaxID=675864 RepID=A0A1G7CE22_9ACTN|nr:NAD(P)/FAD-dependent oxidoreductase [Auraticoccus monumenti]SDE37541.1 Pyruvate/2-oxoglutarate dehydrogenase complex, dihydrolipoamide dehydrogenase (E3) component [Auraticoccus monumenti]